MFEKSTRPCGEINLDWVAHFLPFLATGDGRQVLAQFYTELSGIHFSGQKWLRADLPRIFLKNSDGHLWSF